FGKNPARPSLIARAFPFIATPPFERRRLFHPRIRSSTFDLAPSLGCGGKARNPRRENKQSGFPESVLDAAATSARRLRARKKSNRTRPRAGEHGFNY